MHRFTPLEIKEPILKARALQAAAVRRFIATHPEGVTSEQINAAVKEGGYALDRLRRLGLVRHEGGSPMRREARWFAVSMRAEVSSP